MTTISTTEAENNFIDLIRRTAQYKERVILTHDGEELAVLVPIEDAQLLEELEDRLDVAEAKRILADPEEDRIPFEQVIAELGLQPADTEE